MNEPNGRGKWDKTMEIPYKPVGDLTEAERAAAQKVADDLGQHVIKTVSGATELPKADSVENEK